MSSILESMERGGGGVDATLLAGTSWSHTNCRYFACSDAGTVRFRDGPGQLQAILVRSLSIPFCDLFLGVPSRLGVVDV